MDCFFEQVEFKIVSKSCSEPIANYVLCEKIRETEIDSRKAGDST